MMCGYHTLFATANVIAKCSPCGSNLKVSSDYYVILSSKILNEYDKKP